ncbi:hypothetical protein JCM5296_004703, partial [Sporobolomyces johnsonii]
MSTTQVASTIGDKPSTAEREALSGTSRETDSPLARVSGDRKNQAGAERALFSDLTPVRELPGSAFETAAGPTGPAHVAAALQQEDAAQPSEEAPDDNWEIASTRSARRKARKEGSMSGASTGGSSSESESDYLSRRRRRARHVPIYRRVSFNVPTPETVRGQSVRDDLEAATHPLGSRREQKRAVLVTPHKVLYNNKDESRLKLLSDELNGNPPPTPARSAWIFEQIAEIVNARVRRQQEYHEAQSVKPEVLEEAPPVRPAAAAAVPDATVGGSFASTSRNTIESITEGHEPAPAATPAAPETAETKQSKKDGKRREDSRELRESPNDPDDDPSSGESSSEDEAARRKRKKAEKKARRLRKLRELETSGETSDEALAPRRTNNAKVPVPEKYSGVDNRARSLAKWSREVRTYLLSSNVDPDCLAATGYIAGCLTGRAAEIFSHVVVQAVNEQFIAGKGYRKSPWAFSQIVDLLKERFVSITSVRDAQRQFRELKQWKKNGTYMPVNELAMKLEELGEEKTEVTDWELKRTFLDALDPNIASKTFPLFASDFESREVKYQDVVAEAIVQEQIWMQEMAANDAKRAGSTLSNYEAFNDHQGHRATVDNGSSTTFMHPATVAVRGIKVLKYEKPKTLKLGTKGSKAKILAFCFAKLEVGKVNKRQRFEIAQVEDEVLIGRDFLRAHDCTLEFEPDRLRIRRLQERKTFARKTDELAEVSLGKMSTGDGDNSKDLPLQVEVDAAREAIMLDYKDVLLGEDAPLKAPPY